MTELLVEEYPVDDEPGLTYAFHAPLNRAACEALGRATAARLGRRFGRDLALQAADLGWSIRLPEGAASRPTTDLASLLTLDRLDDDVLEGLDRGDLPAQRFRYIAATGLMVLRNPEQGRRVRVGGLNWVSSRLYPLVKAACPHHPLLRETRREVLHDLLDVPAAVRWLESQAGPPAPQAARASRRSPRPGSRPAADEPLQFESPADALRRLHARLTTAGTRGGRMKPQATVLRTSARRRTPASRVGSSRPGRSGRSTPASGPPSSPTSTLATSGPAARRATACRPIRWPRPWQKLEACWRGSPIDAWSSPATWWNRPGRVAGPPPTSPGCALAGRAWRQAGGARGEPRSQPRLDGQEPGLTPWPRRSMLQGNAGLVAGWTIAHGHRPCRRTGLITGHHHPVLRVSGHSALLPGGRRADHPARLLRQRRRAGRRRGPAAGRLAARAPCACLPAPAATCSTSGP